MFAEPFHIGRIRAGPASAGCAGSGCGRARRLRSLIRLGALSALFAAGVPGGVSAQALGTMQVTARVLPGQPGWAGLSEARALAQEVLSRSSVASQTRRAGLVQARAELAPADGRRRLLVTINYPQN